MAEASAVGLEIGFEKLPFLESARKYAGLGAFAGGLLDNRLTLVLTLSSVRHWMKFPR